MTGLETVAAEGVEVTTTAEAKEGAELLPDETLDGLGDVGKVLEGKIGGAELLPDETLDGLGDVEKPPEGKIGGAELLPDETHDGKENLEKQEQCLTDEEKSIIKKETGWSNEVIDNIKSMEQYRIYKNADLHEIEINGRKTLAKAIDMNYIDPKTGKTNRELMSKGRSPIDAKTGEKIELHHMGQNPNGSFAELAENSEHGDGNHSILHPKTKDGWRNDSDLKKQYDLEKSNYWKTRAKMEG